MIRLPDVALPAETLSHLADYQREVDQAGEYSDQVAAAKRLFKNRNHSKDKAFPVVRTKLNEMCGGSGRCCYCELSQPDEIDHFRPKDWFPEQVFVWENYVYSCGTCNGPKNNRFAIFRNGSNVPHVLVRTDKKAPVIAPPKGECVLIDPRKETPLDFMEIDLIDTFYFVPIFEKGTKEYERALYTIDVLQLNEGRLLPKARRNSFVAFRAILLEYSRLKKRNADSRELNSRIRAIKESPHPAVWQEMKRQRKSHLELKKLFQSVPEADSW